MEAELKSLGEPYAAAARPGTQALRGYSTRVRIADGRRLTGSIDLDNALLKDPRHANAARWDYGIGFVEPSTRDRCVVWVEVHAATTARDASKLINKLSWLKTWLEKEGRTIRPLTQAGDRHLETGAYVWIATGAVKLPKANGHVRRLASLGVRWPRKFLELP
jgi:hypothetical protein